jgi:hypothetical protein
MKPADGGANILMKHSDIRSGSMDPSEAQRLETIEAVLDQILKQDAAIIEAIQEIGEGIAQLYMQGKDRLDDVDEKLDRIEKLLETINLRLAGKP